MAKIAVLGHGVVGSGVCEVIKENHESIVRRAGQNIEVKRILDLRDFDDLDYKDKFTKNYEDILNDDEISIVVEVMGGINPAFEFSARALKLGKSVVTSNKELVAAKGAELLKLAKEHNCNYYFEASVGGGIPIIRPMHLCLAANEIDEIAGILNGTTNFILTKMIHEHMGFEEALKLAQDLGYAERNPSADVDGHDACRKICILADLAFGKEVKPQNVFTKGISDLTLDDVSYANDYGCVIKLIAAAKRLDNTTDIECMVTPAFVKKDSQLANIDDVFNGVLVRGNATGDVVFYGKGAGKLPTASAVVADVIDIAKSSGTSTSLTWEACEENTVVPIGKTQAQFYIRLFGKDEAMLKKHIEREFSAPEYLLRDNKPSNEAAFVCEKIFTSDLKIKLDNLKKHGIIIMSYIRVTPY